MLNITCDMSKVQSMLRELSNSKARAVTSMAINDVAFRVREETVKEMNRVFRNPTPFTLGAFVVHKATPNNLQADIDYARGRNYMPTEIEGGDRHRKGMETLLIMKGIMPPDTMAVPGKAARMDQYGGMSKGQIVQILSFFQTFSGKRAKSNRADDSAMLKSGVAFMALTEPKGKLRAGIYERYDNGKGQAAVHQYKAASKAISAKVRTRQITKQQGATLRRAAHKQMKLQLLRGIRPVLMFSPKKAYAPRLHFFDVGQQVINNNIDAMFSAAFKSIIGQ